jgi:TRAP-type C4-dicarboxylate transport system substrate-binding protein
MCRLAVGAALACVAVTAAAEPHVLRMASPAPEGTAWAREIRAFSREVETLTHGDVRLKWYLSGVAGDEVQMGERMRRDQLDGVASGGMLCQRLAPSMRVLAVVGLFGERAESGYVATRLRATLDAEFAQSGYVNLTEVFVGPQVLFTREPVQSLADLRRVRLWIWDLDDVSQRQFGVMGVHTVPLPLDKAGPAYDQGRIDGFVAVPSAALAFQWSTQARWLTPLRIAVLQGCLILTHRAFDQLPLDAQEALRSAAAKTSARLDDLGRQQDEALLGGLFAHHGLRFVRVGDRFRGEFLEAAQAAREKLGGALVPDALMLKVATWLADYRAEHPSGEAHP